MFLSDENIIEILTDYINDERYEQAVLIDGDWGSGKTHFVKHRLISSLNSVLETPEKGKCRSVMYISLYGIETPTQIIDEICAALWRMSLVKKLGLKKGETIHKGINIAGKVIATGMKHFNIDAKDLPKILDLKKLENNVLVFDDLERCSIEINQLLGFINNIVEHDSTKVIIVANQAEIGKHKLYNDLPQKYSVILNPQLDFPQHDEPSTTSRRNTDSADARKISYAELRQHSEQLFRDDVLYDKVKEKLIGITIHYKADLNMVYDALIDKYIKIDKVRDELLAHKAFILEIFNKRQHYNIRTVIFALLAYEKIASIVTQISFEPEKYVAEQKKRILKYIITTSIKIKTGEKLISWASSSQTGDVSSLTELLFSDDVFGYRFVDVYLTTYFIDPDEVKSVIQKLMDKELSNERSSEADRALSFNKLQPWRYQDDDDITMLLCSIKAELASLKYHPRYFKDIIVALMQLQHFGFPYGYDAYYESIVNSMKCRLEQVQDDFDKWYMEIHSDDNNMIARYNAIMAPVFEAVRVRERAEKERIGEIFDFSKSWGKSFSDNCSRDNDVFFREKKFFYFCNPKKTIDKLKTSNVRDIWHFIEGIDRVYSFSNLGDFYKDDVENITELLSELHVDDVSEGKVTRKIALNSLRVCLENALQRIQK